MSSSSAPAIAVVGAAGEVGRRVCAALVAGGARVALVGRRPDALVELAAEITGEPPIHVADAHDAPALGRALAGARVVVNAAAPLADTLAPVLGAALAAGAHYVDIGGEQAALQAAYERHESAVRRAGLVALPGAGLDCAIGDLAAAWAAGHVAGATDPAGELRDAPLARLAEDHPLDDIAIGYAFDDLALSAGTQRTAFGAVGARPQIWQRDRYEPGAAGDRRIVNAGPALGGARDAVAYAGGDPIAIPRHVAAHRVASYLSVTRSPGASAALRLLARALPLVPRRAGALLVPYIAPDADYARTRFAVVAQVRRGFASAQIVVHGANLYRATAAITAWAAHRLAARDAGPTGMLAPCELFGPEPALRAIARTSDLTIEPSFG